MPESVEMKGTENSQGREDDSGRNINDNEQVVDKWMESDVNQVKHLRPSDLKGLTKTSLEKTMQYSYRLRQRAKCEWLDADKILTIGSSLEEFATCLVEPLKYNKPKTAILAHNIDRVARNAVLYEQKKFLCHMVLYELLMRRWSGMFYSNRYSSKFTAGWFKWVLLNLWTICDTVLFPVVFFCLYLFHKIVTLLKDKQTYHVIFLLKKSTEHSIIDTFPIMQSVCIRTIDSFKPIRCSYACIIHKDNELLTHPFCNKRDIRVALQGKKSSMERTNPQDDGFIKAKELFSTCNNSSKKVLVIITDGSISTYSHDLPTGTEVIAVGIGENLCVEYLKNLTDKKENVILHHDDSKTVCQQISRCIYGRDMYDCYKEYFTTPYFIFFRDTFSYIILLGLHFAMCLQPSSLHFTSIEWIILLFFVGRFMMEVEQYVRLRNQLRSTQFTATSKYSSDPWNRMDVLTLLIYTVLLVLRATGWSMHGSVHKNRVLAISGYLYGLNAMIITLRVFGHIMENNAYLGAIQIALLQIIGSSLAIFGQFFAALIAFSLAITKVYVAEISYNSPANTTTSYGLCNVHGGISCWWSLTKYLAWSVLGFGGLESLQSEDDTSEGIVQALYALFLILSVVMLMNMMIALLSNTYQRVQV